MTMLIIKAEFYDRLEPERETAEMAHLGEESEARPFGPSREAAPITPHDISQALADFNTVYDLAVFSVMPQFLDASCEEVRSAAAGEEDRPTSPGISWSAEAF